jgi:peptidoglycan glycosyltransferase
MNRALLRISLACLAMFVLLLLNVNYVQGFETAKLAGETGNIRVFNEQFTFPRGTILATGDGTDVKIAESLPVKGTNTYARFYPAGKVYAPVTGYDTIYGKTGIEEAENSFLAGSAPQLAVHNLTALLTGKQKQGATVELTISPAAQQAAYAALAADGGHAAALVALNPSTGAILALASYPTFNPNVLTTLNGLKFDRIDKALVQSPAQPLLNRAINDTFPPGSTFKIVTSSAAFSQHLLTSTASTVNAPQPLKLPNGNLLNNDGDSTCSDGHPPVITAFLLSCNTAFANLGIKVTGPKLRDQASLFGMNRQLSIPLAVTPSVIPENSDPSLTALSAIGQLSDRVSPLQEAMFAAAIENGGQLMYPYLVQEVLGPGLSVIEQHAPTVLDTAVSPQVASNVKAMMFQVTQNPAGTAYQTAGPPATNIPIYGKTGTAESGLTPAESPDDAVFSCFVPAGAAGLSSPIAIGVIVQGGGFGADAAAPIAVDVIKAYLAAHT